MDIYKIIEVIMSYVPVAALILYGLVLATKAIVEVLKKVIPALPTAILVFIVAIVVTMLAVLIAAAVLEITVMWYYAVGAVVLGLFVAYAAMFGFDKFKEIYEKLKGYKDI